MQAAPAAFFAVHAPMPQNSVVAQSESAKHVVPHVPVITLQIAPACPVPAQSAFAAQRPQEPSILKTGLAVVGHGALAAVPLSPFAATHRLALYTGRVGLPNGAPAAQSSDVDGERMSTDV